MTKTELYQQSLADLVRVAILLSRILEEKELTDEENMKIRYSTAVMDDVGRRQKIINKKK